MKQGMTPVQYFLGKAIEEAGELIQILAKTQAFGVNQYYDKDPLKRSNIERVNMEFNDLLATIERLNLEINLEGKTKMHILRNPTLIKAKLKKLQKYFLFSIRCGMSHET